jgi:hypothetical protein
MTGTGCYARRMFDLIELKLCQRLHWHRTSPVTSNASYISSCPIIQFCARGRAELLYAVGHGRYRTRLTSADVLNAIPRPKQQRDVRRCAGTWTDRTSIIDSAAKGQSCLLMLRVGRRPPRPLSSTVRKMFNILVSWVTTPAPMGAIFRNKGGSLSPTLPWMEEGTQGVSPSFKEEVAWGPGWFCSPAWRVITAQ